MYKEYQNFINDRYLNSSPATRKHTSDILKQLPPLSKLTKKWILSFLSSKKSPFTKCNCFKCIKLVLTYYNRSELIEGIIIKKPKSRLKQSDLLTSEQISSILRACPTLRDRAIIEFLLETGCRIGELLNLNLEDIIIEEKVIMVSLDGKTGIRQIPLLKDNLTSFLFYIGTHPIGSDAVFITSNKNKSRLQYNSIRKRMLEIYKQASIKRPKQTFHIFRHMKATHLVELGIPEEIIRKFLGWTSSSEMISVYVHLTSKSVKDYFLRIFGITQQPIAPLYPKEEKERIKELFG